uniref:cytosolic sulfotransferase 13-like n=1 Tax=Fragaria vesca subsp. vesca TaxID=101020 RepID=UPI0005CA34E4|nr:PREDICTED: cytosolic sulfotransferase 13-like [Fragaria vesca subsp. vesca]XP_011462982.1 PREDICTED: cytosolic sulfotransferase 13-like [Fragaria vesca subsp. vesca]
MSLPQIPSSLPQQYDYFQQIELSQEIRDLISTLPAEEGLISGHLHQYQGFWYPTMRIPRILATQKHFQAHDTDILLATTPKSGTTWLKAILFALVKRVHYHPHPQNIDHPLLTNNSHPLVPFLENKQQSGENQIPDANSYAPPRLFSTHLPLAHLPQSVKDSACKVVYLCRNPKDIVVSLWHFTNRVRHKSLETNSLEKVFQYFCRGMNGYGPFWDHVLGYWKESLERPETVFFVKYEEMKEKPGLHLRRLAEFLGCPFSPEEEAQGVVDNVLKLCSFETLSNLDVNKNGRLSTGVENSVYFRQGKAGDWKNYLTAEMVEQLDRITEEKLQGSGLKF